MTELDRTVIKVPHTVFIVSPSQIVNGMCNEVICITNCVHVVCRECCAVLWDCANKDDFLRV